MLQQSSVAPTACCDCTYQAKIWTHAALRSCQPWEAFEVGRSLEEGRERCQVFVQVSNKHVGFADTKLLEFSPHDFASLSFHPRSPQKKAAPKDGFLNGSAHGFDLYGLVRRLNQLGCLRWSLLNRPLFIGSTDPFLGPHEKSRDPATFGV